MVLIAVDKLNRKVLGYLCRNGSILTYCCVECDVEFEAANQLEEHMLKHELWPQEKEEEEEHQQQQIDLKPNEEVPNENEGMEADTTNRTNSEVDIPLTQEEIENRLCSVYDLKQCSIPLFRFNYDINDLKGDSDETSNQSTSAGEENEKPFESAKTLRKRAKAPSPRSAAGGPRKKLFECEHCSMTFIHAGHFRRHYISAHPIVKPFLCYLCGSKFFTNDELTEHHQHHQPDNTKAPVFPCPTCGKNVQNLKRHLRDHELEIAYEVAMSTGDDMIIESIDDTLTEPTDDGIKQENRHSFDANDFQQTIGLKVECIATSDSELNVSTTSNIQNGVDSMDTDMDIKPPTTSTKSKIKKKWNSDTFRCTQCPKRFRLEVLLNQHLRNHERPRIPCPVCGKRITQSYTRAHLLKFHRPNIDIITQTDEQQIDAEYIVDEI